MKERPILFSGPMVRAILEGRKTQTRRVMKPQPQPNGIWLKSLGDFLCLIDEYPPSATIWNGAWLGADAGELNCCPYGAPGDRLWVRETWSNDWEHNHILYRADADEDGSVPYLMSGAGGFGGGVAAAHIDRWRPSTNMPHWASRLSLEVKSVRVERLQDISEDDARAEGVAKAEATDGAMSYALGFSDLWDSINAKRGYGWDSNPWVWVIEFEQIKEAS